MSNRGDSFMEYWASGQVFPNQNSYFKREDNFLNYGNVSGSKLYGKGISNKVQSSSYKSHNMGSSQITPDRDTVRVSINGVLEPFNEELVHQISINDQGERTSVEDGGLSSNGFDHQQLEEGNVEGDTSSNLSALSATNSKEMCMHSRKCTSENIKQVDEECDKSLNLVKQKLPSTSGMTSKSNHNFIVDTLTDEEIYQMMSFEIMRDSIYHLTQQETMPRHELYMEKDRDIKESSSSFASNKHKRKLIEKQEHLEPFPEEPSILRSNFVGNVTDYISNYPTAKRFCPTVISSSDTFKSNNVTDGINFPRPAISAIAHGSNYFPMKLQSGNAKGHSNQDWFGTSDTSTKSGNISYINVDTISGDHDKSYTQKHTLIEKPAVAYPLNCSVKDFQNKFQ